jgi:parallel beta-helix repeat protein
MKTGKFTGRVLGIALALVLVGAMLPLGAFGNHSQVEASPLATSLALIWESEDIGSVTSMAIDDVDGDGVTEVICGTVTSFDKGTYTYHGYVYIFNALTHELEWKSNDIGYVTDIIATDLDDDGNYEIVAQTHFGRSAIIGNCYGYVHVFDGASHEQRWKSSNIGAPGDLAVADLDGNYVKEIIVGGMHDYSCTRHGHVYVFDGAEFSQKWKSPDINSPSRILVADVDDDDVKEIIFGNCVTDCAYSDSEGGWYYPGYVYIFDGTSFAQEWQSADIGIGVSLIVNDVDDDGTGELIAGIHRASEPNVECDRGYIYIFDGRTHSQEWKSSNIDTAYGLRVDDIDNDGIREIIARTAQPHTAAINAGHIGHLHVFDGKTHDEEWISDNLGDAYCLGVNDVENDGVQEILTRFLHDSGWYLGIWSGETHDQEWQSTDDVGGFGGVIIPYVNDEGDREIVVGGGETEGRDYPYPDEVYHGRLYVFGQAMPSPVQITNEPGDELYPDQSADGQYIVMTSNRDGGKGDIWRIDSDGTNFLKLSNLPDSGYSIPRYAWNPVFHPAGEYVYYMDNSPTGSDLHWFLRTKTDGTGGREPILFIPGGDCGGKLAFSPDGSTFAFIYCSYDEYGTRFARRDIIIAHSDGSDLGTSYSRDQMRNELGVYRDDNMSEHWGIAWSPDGTRIYFQREDDSGMMSLYSTNADGTDLARLTPPSLGYCISPAISPDGTRIAFQSRESAEADYELFVMNIDGSDIVQLTDNDFEDQYPTWSYDGSSIVYSSNADGDYDLYMIAPGAPDHAPNVEVMTWVPPYLTSESKLAAQADFGTCDPKDGLTRISLQWWVPMSNGKIKYNDKHDSLDDDDVAWWTAWGHENGIEILLCIAAVAPPYSWDIARSAFINNTATLVDSIVSEMDRLSLDGIDIDFESCNSEHQNDRDAFAQFIHHLSVELNGRGKTLTVCSHALSCAPKPDWWQDWLGEVDNIVSMGYEETYEGGIGWHKYSSQQDFGYEAGYAGDVVLMGIPAYVAEWGTSSGRGTSPLAHVQEIRYDLPESTGIAIWDLHWVWEKDYWHDPDLWCEIKGLKENIIPIPATIYVPDDYSTIQAAVNDASSGDTIIVYPGTYTENVSVNKDHLTIQSQNGADSTITQAANPNDHVFEVTADYVNISGFTIKGATGKNGVYLKSAQYCDVSNNDISNNYNGVCLYTASHNKIMNNNVSNNVGAFGTNNPRGGVYLYNSNGNKITHNDLSHNQDGIVLKGSSNENDVEHNNVKSNDYWGIILENSHNNKIASNTVNENGWGGIRLKASSSNNNIIRNSVSKESRGIYLGDSNNNCIYLNNFVGNSINADSASSSNIWNSASKIEYSYKGRTYADYLGNYWSDYTGTDADGDGIGETPYQIDSDSDNYPLVEPFENYQIGLTVTWNCPLGGYPLIAPNPDAGRPSLSVPVACEDITVSGGAQLWGIYYLVETGPQAGTWLWYIPGFTTSTLTQLEPDKLHWVVVSALCTLTIPQG